jgi:hypothetical protein
VPADHVAAYRRPDGGALLARTLQGAAKSLVMLERKFMSAPENTAPSTNVVKLHASPADAVEVALRMQEMYRQSCLEVVAGRIDWLMSGISCWPDSLITREHLLTQLRTLADGARQIAAPEPKP